MRLLESGEFLDAVRMNQNHSFCAVEDLISFLCSELDPKEVLVEVDEKHDVLDLCVWCKDLQYAYMPEKGVSKGWGIPVEHLPKLISMLPGQRAANFLTRYMLSEAGLVEKSDYIENNRQAWEKRGRDFRAIRRSLSLTIRKVSSNIGTSSTRLSRFEKGYPVRDAQLIEHSCMNLFELSLLRRKRATVDEFDYFYGLLDRLRNPWRYENEDEQSCEDSGSASDYCGAWQGNTIIDASHIWKA